MSDSPQHKVGDSDELDGPSVTAVADEPAVIREKAPDVNPGDLLANRYQVEAILGKGGSGVVLRAFDRTAQAPVAVKLLRPTLTHDPQWEKRFSRELRLGRPIRHPNVCRIFDIGDADGYRFLTMELATGGTLRELIKRNEPLRPINERLTDAAGVIAGLAAIHEVGIVHRDVKTDNILRMEDGRLVLSDFGLATDLPTATMVSVFVGTPHYMAPEVREGEPATTRSDVWSLGVVLHEIFFGRRPERRTSRSGAGSYASRSTSTLQTSAMIERAMFALCERCLADDPAERPADAGVVRGLLEKAQGSPRSIIRSKTRKRLIIASSMAVLVLALGFGVYRATWRDEASRVVPLPSLLPAGEPSDWSNSAAVVATIPGKVHCFTLSPDESTARVIWGTPRRAEDIDVATGSRRPSRLLAETYAAGCPQLSPRGDRLLFSAPTTAGASEIKLSSAADGADAVTVTPGIEPVWLRNGEEFLYSIDPYHAAVFSLPTMGFNLLPDPGLGGRQVVTEKVASRDQDVIAVQFVDQNSRTAVAVYEGGAPILRTTMILPSVFEIAFDRSDDLLVSFRPSRVRSTLAALGWRNHSFRHIGRYPDFELLRGHRTANGALVALARHRTSDAWLYGAGGKRKVSDDGITLSGAVSQRGDILLGKRSDEGIVAIWLRGSDGIPRQVTEGPLDVRPDFSPDARSWAYVDYARKNIMLCTGMPSPCRVLLTDDHLPSWPRFSPDGANLAYVTQVGTQRVMVVSLQTGAVKEVGPAFSQCPPVWSTATKLWTFEGSPKRYFWAEREVQTGVSTGRRIELGDTMNDAVQDPDESRCWPPSAQADNERFPRLRVETDERFRIIRLDSAN